MDAIAYPNAAVLEGVEPLHFYDGKGPRCPEDITFPSVMRTVMEYLGENLGCKTCRPNERGWGLGCAYSYFMGVSGLAFAMNWKPGFGEETFGMMRCLSEDPGEVHRRAFAAAGYSCERVDQSAGEAVFREKIKASIVERKRPMVAIGVVGPPEAAIITGYEANGDVLVGTTFFNFLEPDTPVDQAGYFHRAGWFANTPEIVLVGEKSAPPQIKDTLLDALRFGAQIMARPSANGMPTGAAAYDAWAADLLDDAAFPPEDEATLKQRHDTHNFLVGQLAELRWYGSVWLAGMNERVDFQKVEALLKAAGSLAAEHKLMWDLWNLAGGIANPEAWRELAKPEVRRAMAEVVLESKQKYLETQAFVAEVLRN